MVLSKICHISVIVCTYNRADSLRDTLNALKEQKISSDLSAEVIVVDNNSADDTQQVVEQIEKSAKLSIHYVFEKQQGLSHARNKGIQVAKGDIVIFTDDDVIPEPNWIQAISDTYDTHQADCVGGKILPQWMETPPEWMSGDWAREHIWVNLALLDRGEQVIVAEKSNPLFLFGANISFRRSVFNEVGLFRTDLGRIGNKLLSGEESEMVRRFFKAGKRVVYTPQAVVYHKIEPERIGLTFLRKRKFYGARNAVQLSREPLKNFKPWLIRECFSNGIGVLTASMRQNKKLAVERDLRFWTQLGEICEMVKMRWSRKAASNS